MERISLRRRGGIVALVATWVSAVWMTATPAWSQTPPARGRQFVDDMVRSLIDNREPQDASRRSRPQSTAEIREVRANLAGFAQEISQLVAVLYQDANRTAGMRSLMPEALQMSARATMLARQSAKETNIGVLANEFAEVDQDWRLLAFRLRELDGLSSQAEQLIQRADDFHARLAQSLQVAPQPNRTEATRAATTLSADLERLLKEVDFGVNNAQQRYDLLVEGRAVYQQSRQLATQLEQSDSLDIVRNEFRRFRDLWAPFVARLRPLQQRYIDRQLQSVQESIRELQEVLMLPAEMDRSELIYLTQLLQRDLDQLMDGVTLRSLSQLTRGRDRIIADSADFYGACTDFAECVRLGESPDTMKQVYYYLDTNWQRVADTLRDAESGEARQVYRQLDRSIAEIRDILEVRSNVDEDRMAQVAAAIDNLAIHLEHDIRSAISARPANYAAQFRKQVTDAAAQFRDAARQFNTLTVAGDRSNRTRDAATRVVQRWNSVNPLVNQFAAADRDHLLLVRQQIIPAVVELQSLVAVP